MRKRLDVLLVERGLAESRAQAQALVMAGRVPGHSKAGEQVDERAEIVVEGLVGTPPAAVRSSRTRSTSSASTSPDETRSTSARPPAGSRTSSSSVGQHA